MSGGPILIMAGGTGGHIFPGLAVADALRADGRAVAWLGAHGGLEVKLVAGHDVTMHLIPVQALRGHGWRRLLAAPWMLARSVWAALVLLRRLRPASVLSMGGFVAGPGGVAAWLLRRPLVVHEQNAIAGFTNRQLARLAGRRLVGFEGALPRAVWTGNPVRAEIAALAPPRQRLAGRAGRPRLLVLGGSQGARILNQNLAGALARLPAEQRPEVLHQAGAAGVELARAAYREAGVVATIEPFLDDMAAAYAWADLAVCRAGALTLAELSAAGLGALLVPYGHAVDDHQTANARALVAVGAASLLAESELNAARLAAELQPLLGDRPRQLAMADAARSLARPDAAREIARHCLEVAS